MTETIGERTVAQLDAIPLGEGRTFDVGNERVAVFHLRSGEVFAVQAECPHKGGPLADGLLGGTTLVCPLHSWKFDLKTGQPIFGSCSLKTYPARTNQDGLIILTLPGSE